MKTDIFDPGREQIMARLLTGPAFPDRPFSGNKTHGDVFAMARAVLDDFPPDKKQQELLGMFTENRASIAACILAAMAGGPIPVFPHDISDSALMDLTINTGITRVTADPERALPRAVKRLSLHEIHHIGSKTSLATTGDKDAPLLKLHTGGSTGKPSIWTKTVTNIMMEAEFHAGFHNVIPDDVIVATVPPYHIYGLLFSVVIPLIAGASVVDGIFGFPREIINAVSSNSATLLVTVPAHYRALRGHTFFDHCLRLAFSSAGTLDKNDEAAFRSQSRTPVMEVYGSTETGGIAFRCRARSESFFTPFDPIETRMSGSEFEIRSPFISPEIPTDDQGYYLVPDRIEPHPGNTFAIIGRADTVVKIAGKRIDLDHIKAVLKKKPGVRDAFIYAEHTPTGRQFDIYALVEGNCENSDIREFLSKTLEPAAHPRRFKFVEKMPVTRAGKYDRSAIEALFAEDSERDR